ncbi:MAG: hypothetical protein ACOCRN_03210 [Spirochaetia bacterium]
MTTRSRRRGPVRARRRRRARRTGRRYSLEYLLSRQPKGLRKHNDYPQLIAYLRNTPSLRKLGIPRRCYSLLHNARVTPENLEHFYRTYRLPRHPFFPLLLRIKRDYLAERVRIRQARRLYIREHMRALPEPVIGFIRYLGHFENEHNGAGYHPLWQEHLFPSTKKRVHALEKLTQKEWVDVFRAHLALLEQRYRTCRERDTERLLACYVLEYIPEQCPPVWPDKASARKRYRALSLRHHPDRGGDPAMFVELKDALEVLLK